MRWLWAIVVGVVVGLGFAWAWRRNPVAQVKRELKAIDAAKDAQLKITELGFEKARIKIEADHAETIRKFKADQRRHMDTLRRDPVALAVWLTRISK